MEEIAQRLRECFPHDVQCGYLLCGEPIDDVFTKPGCRRHSRTPRQTVMSVKDMTFCETLLIGLAERSDRTLSNPLQS